MSLTNERIFDIFLNNLETVYTHDISVQIIFDYYKKHLILFNDIKVPSIFSKWSKINSRSCYYIIMISIEAESKKTKINNIELYPSFIEKSILKKIYASIYEEYKSICITDIGLSFIPKLSVMQKILIKNSKDIGI